MTAAIQLTRCGLRPLLFEAGTPGGLVRNGAWIENYPGFPAGIAGEDLARLFRRQCRQFAVPCRRERVTELDYLPGKERFRIRTASGAWTAPFVVLGSGTSPNPFPPARRWPGRIRDRVLFEILPLKNSRGKRMLVIGASDAAFDYAVSLSRRNRVWILNRGSCHGAIPPLAAAVLKNPSICYWKNTELKDVAWFGRRLKATVRREKELAELIVDYIIPAVGRQPQKSFYTARLGSLEDSLLRKGRLHLVGDVRNDRFRQVSIAVGDGMRAAMQIARAVRGEA